MRCPVCGARAKLPDGEGGSARLGWRGRFRLGFLLLLALFVRASVSGGHFLLMWETWVLCAAELIKEDPRGDDLETL